MMLCVCVMDPEVVELVDGGEEKGQFLERWSLPFIVFP